MYLEDVLIVTLFKTGLFLKRLNTFCICPVKSFLKHGKVFSHVGSIYQTHHNLSKLRRSSEPKSVPQLLDKKSTLPTKFLPYETSEAKSQECWTWHSDVSKNLLSSSVLLQISNKSLPKKTLEWTIVEFLHFNENPLNVSLTLTILLKTIHTKNLKTAYLWDHAKMMKFVILKL